MNHMKNPLPFKHQLSLLPSAGRGPADPRDETNPSVVWESSRLVLGTLFCKSKFLVMSQRLRSAGKQAKT